MVVLPAVTPVTLPSVLPTVAIDGLLLVHTPPVVASPRVMLLPAHSKVAPDIAATTGAGLMVSALVVVPVPQILVTV